MPRCFHIDLEMDSVEDFSRIPTQIVRDGMLDEYGWTAEENAEIVDHDIEECKA